VRIRIVVLNFNGGEHVLRCLRHLEATTWADGDLELVVVDNASTDGSDAAIEKAHPAVRLVRSATNGGFPANNLALTDLGDVEYVGLVNNDAFVDPGWLGPLVAALDADPTLGAACPRILFAPRFLDVHVRSATFEPPGADSRTLGVRVSAVERDGIDVWRDSHFADGFWGVEIGHGDETRFSWTDGDGRLRVPVGDPPEDPAATQGHLRLRLAGPPGSDVTVTCGEHSATATLGDGTTWVDLPLSGRPYDVVQNAGSVLVEGGYGADRGFLQPDGPTFDDGAEVFAWCGAGVLFPTRYLSEVGTFEERFFMYYEDTDLAWRGRARGWRYRYVPESVVRHLHAATSVEGSALFTHFVERNRLLLLTRNAPASMAALAVVHHLAVTASYARRDVIGPVLASRRPHTTLVRRRLRAWLAYLRLAPAMLVDRGRFRRCQVVPDEELLAWAVPQP
jgi:GT2 family glycosyltransferase